MIGSCDADRMVKIESGWEGRDSESEVLLFRSFQTDYCVAPTSLGSLARTAQEEQKTAPPIDPLVYASSL